MSKVADFRPLKSPSVAVEPTLLPPDKGIVTGDAVTTSRGFCSLLASLSSSRLYSRKCPK